MLAAAAAHDGRPVARRRHLDEDRSLAQALTNHAQGGLRDAHAPAGPLAFGLDRPVQMDARRGLAQCLRSGIDTHRPSVANESLCLDRTGRRQDEQTGALHRAALHGHVEGIAARETPPPQTIVPVADDDDEPEGRAGHPHRRAGAHHDGDAAQGGGDVHAVTLLGPYLAAAEGRGHAKIVLQVAGHARGLLAGRRDDDDAAPRRHGRGHGLR